MSREFVTTGPRQIEIREVDERPLAPEEVRVRSLLTTISHGTELALYRGTAPFATQRFDLETRAFREEPGGTIYPFRLGSEFVGEVTEVGSEVVGVAVGDVVYGNGGHAHVQQLRADAVIPIAPGIDPERALFVHHGCVALNAIHDGALLVGDVVGVFGLGVIGLLTVQLAGLAGARTVYAADPLAHRRELALACGAADAFDSIAADAGLEMKTRAGAGVDVALEVSGTYRGLQDAIRSVRIGGRIVGGGYYQGGGEALRLGEEFLHNRVELVSSMYVWECPHRAHPRWDRARLRETVFGLLASGALDVSRYVTDRIPWEETAAAYRLLDEHPEQTVRVVITYG
ncbi:MAG: zinc-binding alcohol dehydrogenase [Gaiellales bacterium]